MSYQVLARKWRPKSFQELMGQEHVVAVLTNALEQQRLHHAYLFTGTRGVGKTTIARIFAKSLNCDTGVTSTPCGICDTCLDIDQGRFVDLLEIDAASRTKVDDTREILDNVQYAPTRGRYKVYLIDEVHMLSRSSFNALLKTLEEPPEHVKFILATTDPQKLPVTVLSRCLQFHLKALAVPQIEQQLKTILAAEKVTFEDRAVTLLAKAARGSMRDSLSLTDQAIAQGKGNIISANVQQMLGGVDGNWVFKILIALLKQDAQSLMQLSLEIASYAPNYSRLMADLIQLLHQVAMAQIVDRHFDLSPEHNQLLQKFCQAMSPEDVQLYYQIVLTGRKDLPYTGDEQAAFDMVLLRMFAFKPQLNVLDNKTAVNEKTVGVDFDQIQLADTEITLDNSLVHSSSESDVSQAVEPLTEDSNDGINEAIAETPNEVQLTEQMQEIEQQAQQLVSDVHSEKTLAEKNLLDSAGSESIVVSESIDNEVVVKDSPNEKVLISQTDDQPKEKIETIENATSPLNKPLEELAINSSPIESVLASRNMLRSRKKALETEGKKSSGASQRHENQALESDDSVDEKIVKAKPKDVPDIETVPDQPYTPDVINPAEVRRANQVDKWANMIDSMELTGRLRQLAIHSTICDNSTDELLVLKLDQSTKHLKTEFAHKQLETHLSQLLARNITVELELVEQTKDDPFQIQTDINDKRYDYAKELLANDEIIIALQSDFQAQINEESITAR